MSQDAHPNFRVNVYGTNPTQEVDIDRMLPSGGGAPGGGGFPWFGRSKPKVTPPTFGGTTPPYENPAPVDPYQPTDWQGPVQANGQGFLGLPAGLGLADILALLLGGKELFSSGRTQTGSGNPALDAQLADMLKLQQGRLTKSEPLYDAILSMAGGLMPVQYQPKAATATPPPAPQLPPGPIEDDGTIPIPRDPEAARRY